MQQPLQINFRDIPHTPTIETYITEKINKFEQMVSSIISCHVVIGQSQKHKHQGKLYNIRIHMTVPEKVLNSVYREDENIYTAIQMSFDSLKQQLIEYRDKIQRQVKTHPERKTGSIVRLFAHDTFGFIQDSTGEEYYFGLAALHNTHFNQLKIGDKVHFVSFMGNEGLQAHRVNLIH